MKLSTLSKILFCAASLCLAMPLAASAAGHQGCCSRHGGVSQQCSNGYVVCNDGTRSASCLCEGGSVQSRRPKGDGEGYEPRRNPAPQREAARSAKREKPYDPGHHPSQANRPAPNQANRPAPNQVNRPAPNQVNRPAPNQVNRPAPNQASRPAPNQVNRPAPNQVNRPAPNQVNRPAPGQAAPRPANVDKYGRPINAGRTPASGRNVDKYGHAVPKY